MSCNNSCELCTGEMTEELIQSVREGNLEKLKSVLAINAHLNLLSRSCNPCWDKCSILYYAIERCNKNSNGCEILKYILDVGKIDINTRLYNQTICPFPNPYFNKCFEGTKIKHRDKARDPNFIDFAWTPLHYVTRIKPQNTTLLTLLDAGADPNLPDNFNHTPMHLAAYKYGVNWPEAIALMILYGGNINLVSDYMMTPLMHLLREFATPALEFVVDYVFDGLEKAHLDLETLTCVMLKCESPNVFQKIIQNVSKVTLNHKSLENFFQNLLISQPENLKLFIQYVPKIARTVFAKEVILKWNFTEKKYTEDLNKVTENLYTLCTISSVVETITTSNIDFHVLVHNLVIARSVDESTLSGILLHLLSYGLITLTDDETLKKVYRFFGDCQLFRTLLHMDFGGCKSKMCPPLPEIIYNMQLKDIRFPPKYDFSNFTKFFAGQQIKNTILRRKDNGFKQKAHKLPDVPLLLELARNSTRAHIIKFYKVKTSSQFYTILKYLPIYDDYKAIIGLQTPLYKLD